MVDYLEDAVSSIGHEISKHLADHVFSDSAPVFVNASRELKDRQLNDLSIHAKE